MSERLTEQQLDNIMQWACSSDLRQKDGEDLQMLVEEVRSSRQDNEKLRAALTDALDTLNAFVDEVDSIVNKVVGAVDGSKQALLVLRVQISKGRDLLNR